MRKFVANDRARRENVPRHILIYKPIKIKKGREK